VDIPNTSHYGTILNIPISKVFQYYSEVELYPKRYPEYCEKVEKIEELDTNNFKTREVWHLGISNGISHFVVFLKYTLTPPTSILYEVTDSTYEKLKGIKNGIVLEESENNHTSMDYNNVLLDALSFPPHSTTSYRYEELLTYFPAKNSFGIHYGISSPFKKGQLCGKCRKGRLQGPITKEDLEVKGFKEKIQFWECDYCHCRYYGYGVESRG
jgi:hypothetical protein